MDNKMMDNKMMTNEIFTMNDTHKANVTRF